MIIKIEQSAAGFFTAHCVDLTGNPSLGCGPTKELALARLMYESIYAIAQGSRKAEYYKTEDGVTLIEVSS